MEKIIEVKDSYRKNPESLIPGGSIVEVYNNEGIKLVYDKIKNPDLYCAKIIKDKSVLEIYVDGELFYKR